MADQQPRVITPSCGGTAAGTPAATATLPPGNKSLALDIPAIALPKGGGAIKSVDEKFSVNAINGTAGFSLPLPVSAGRGFAPSLSLHYNSGSGNGIFGLGWTLNLASIKRKTDKKLPQYTDAADGDSYILSDAEELVPVLKKTAAGQFVKDASGDYVQEEFSSTDNKYTIKRYRPSIESAFARIERWTEKTTGIIHWRVTTRNNSTSIYGHDPLSRIADPADPMRIYEWLLDFSYDSKGHSIKYEYKQEDHIGLDTARLHNKNRANGNARFANSYLKRVRYGNISPYKNHDDPLPTQWLFETVFDYGEHDLQTPDFAGAGNWSFRADAFSDYRAGFEIRTCRLCRRVLLFHHFEELPGGSALIHAMSFSYTDNGQKGFTFLQDITATGFTKHDDGSYTDKSLPPLSFTYQPHQWNKEVKAISKENLVHAPAGIDGQEYRFADLYSEGLPGILSEQQGGWFYKKNNGDGQFAAAVCIRQKPSFNGLGDGISLTELEADGIKQIVHWKDTPQGFFELDTAGEWQPFRAFNQVPNIDFQDPNLHYIDLDGDGRADLLITEEDIFTWYPSAGKTGFAPSARIAMERDEEKGPVLRFANRIQTIFLADMSGDGLTDLVRVRNGEVCYWPNLGYGKFGARVNMDQAPVFDHPDQYNPAFIELADMDGSGTTDLVYFGNSQYKVWLNQSGNGFTTEPVVIETFPASTGNTTVSILDILGNGLPCLVWNSDLPAHAGEPLRYIDLLGGRKPHILTGYKNNMGREVALEYLPSTAYYISDELKGEPWVTKLPFPVYCVAKIIIHDRIMKTRFASEYFYHHGYYDHYEREFRGFARVDQKDSEDIVQFIKQSNGAQNNVTEEALHQPPVLKKTWYHTGAFLDRERILGQFRHEYYQNEARPELLLAEPQLPAGLSIEEWRQALRSCKGTLLRTEIYALDDSPQSGIPYVVLQHNAMVQLLQPATLQKAVFLLQESENISYQYERNPADPRVAHHFTLEVDEWGTALQSADVLYPRRLAGDDSMVEPEQLRQHVIFSVIQVTNAVELSRDYAAPLPYTQQSFELTGLAGTATYYSPQEIRQAIAAAQPIGYEEIPSGALQKRVIEYSRYQYRGDDGIEVLPHGTLQSKGLSHQVYTAAFTPGLLAEVFETKLPAASLHAMLTDPAKGGYIFADGYFWIPSGTSNYDPDHFYIATIFTDPFGHTTTLTYDENYFLFIRKITDPAGNEIQTIQFNYRTLSPLVLQDSNDNLSAVRFDELGKVIRNFSIGKKGIDAGDEFDDTKVEIKDAADFAGVDIVYHLLEWYQQTQAAGFDMDDYKPHPNFVHTTIRDTHYHADPLHQAGIIENYTYSDGAGHIVLSKMQAEPGKALKIEEDGTVTEVDTTLTSPVQLRWVGNGRLILNNKGNPVKHYEPYFSLTPAFDDEKEMLEQGVTPVVHYDPLNRIVRVDMPNGAYAAAQFDAWQEVSFDQNDTVLQSRWYADRITDPVPGKASPEEMAIAAQTVLHDNTPAISLLDPMGRTFLLITDKGAPFLQEGETADNRFISERLTYDIRNNELSVTDSLGRTVMQGRYDMLGNRLLQQSMDTGSRRTINDIQGKTLLHWDDRDQCFGFAYDALGRQISTSLTVGAADPVIIGRTQYGEEAPDSKSANLRGALYREFDQSGVHTNNRFDFKGNLLQSEKQFARDYKNTINWANIATIVLEPEIFTTSTDYDGLSRPWRHVLPYSAGRNASEIFPQYNEAGLPGKMEAQLPGVAGKTVFVSKITYNAKAQREEIIYGNNTKTKYTYEKETFRLKKLHTTRNAGDLLQSLDYHYDPMGNIKRINDSAQPAVFFDGEEVKALWQYEYDALYRLVKASGRKHAGQTQLRPKETLPANDSLRNYPFVHLADPNAADAFLNYSELYKYDAAGNLLSQQHIARNSSWTRNFVYGQGNQLTTTAIGADTCNYTYDAHGNMQGLETLTGEVWNYADQLKEVGLGGGGRAWYVYDANGQRVRKIVERPSGAIQERLYLGDIEIYRERSNTGTVQLERETLHVADGQRKIAMVDTPVIQPVGTSETQLIRYQYDNHIGSVSLELDEAAQIISYEEYFPYGTTSYYTTDASREVPAKRYRYSGKERDDESGLNYHGARYYASWLCRWTAADPAGLIDGLNLYQYVRSNPIRLYDGSGTESLEQKATKELENYLLEQGVNFEREVAMRVKVNGEWVDGRADFLIEKEKGVWEPLEMKGTDKSRWTDGQKKYIPALKEGAEFEITGKSNVGYKGKGGGKVITFDTLEEAREKFKRIFRFRIKNRTRGTEMEIFKDKDGTELDRKIKPDPPKPKHVPHIPDAPPGIGKAAQKFGKGPGRKIAELVAERGKKFIPGFGIAFGVHSAYENFSEGNYLEGVLDMGGVIPGPIGDAFDIIGTGYAIGKLVVEEMDAPPETGEGGGEEPEEPTKPPPPKPPKPFKPKFHLPPPEDYKENGKVGDIDFPCS